MYLSLLLPEERAWKRLRKCTRWADFHPLALELLTHADLRPEADFARIDQASPFPAPGETARGL